MKKASRFISALLTAALLFGAVSIPSSAFEKAGMTQKEWDKYYASLIDDNTLPTLCVGADETRLNITWHAEKSSATPKVQLATNAAMRNAATFTGKTVPAENDNQLVCRVEITGIKPNTDYYYRWYTENGWSKAYKYQSHSFDKFKMLVVGDIQIGGQSDNSQEQSRVGYAWQKVLDEALSKNPDISFLLSPGDNTSTGRTADEWQTLLMPESLRSLPLALAIGNHDKKGMSYNYYTYMPNEYYGKYFTGLDRDFWFRYGDMLCLVFDATSGSAADHRAMAEEAVKANPDAKWRVGVMHQALYGAGFSVLDPETGILLNGVFQPIFEMYDLDIVFTGHSHMQGRSKFIAGGIAVQNAKSGKTYTDPRGIIYLNSNAVCDSSASTNNPWSAYSFNESGITTYTTVDFTDSSMAVKTFRGDNSALLDSITINKTKAPGGFSLRNLIKAPLYKIVELLGLVYMKIDAKVVKRRGGHY